MLKQPKFTEYFEPDRTNLSLEFAVDKTVDKNRRQKVATKSSDKAVTKKTKAHREKILALIPERAKRE